MHLLLSKNDLRNTVLVRPDGQAVYRINTPHNLFGRRTTKIKRVHAINVQIGKIKWHTFRASKLWTGGRQVQLHKSGIFSHSKIFQARDGQNYIWKTKNGHPMLVGEGHSRTVATFHKPKWGILSKSRLASLEITAQGMEILDDIVTTFVWFEQNRRKRKQASSAG
ncbi:hypothetical protein PILCRDRAFT_814774 [Piloderma croceum F 1598]|uniref:DUF6593 domain-containing protein n=1 Tax=Piloderma croceum (strain F 1598) TaxID=765440 RepID=A0A0C3G9H7_PILCF|nr:hypothetical protein PILCRDRAFT_814774 [Piloderma croceum F 1598]